MKVYVISLVEAALRRNKIAKQLEAQGINFDFFDAKRGNPEIKANSNYDYAVRDKLYGRQMTAGEIGCFMSHQELWRIIATADRAICIMEDDVLVANNLAQILTTLENYSNYDILKLSGIFKRISFNWENFAGLNLVKYWRDPMGTQCYIIKPAAAQALLAKSARINAPVDDFLANYALHRLNVVACNPYPISHDWEIPSQLGHRHAKRKMRVGEKIRRELIIQVNSARSLLQQLTYWLQAKRSRFK